MKLRNQQEKFSGILGAGRLNQNFTDPASGLQKFTTKVSSESIHGLSAHSGSAIRHATNSF